MVGLLSSQALVGLEAALQSALDHTPGIRRAEFRLLGSKILAVEQACSCVDDTMAARAHTPITVAQLPCDCVADIISAHKREAPQVCVA